MITHYQKVDEMFMPSYRASSQGLTSAQVYRVAVSKLSDGMGKCFQLSYGVSWERNHQKLQ